MCGARFATYEACAQEGALPVSASLRHLELAMPGGQGYSWQLMLVDKVGGCRGRG